MHAKFLNFQLATILAVGTIAVVADTALAKTISLAEGHKIINSCDGAKWSAGDTTATSGCMNKNGHGVVCGGKDPKYQNNCSTFRLVRHDIRRVAGHLGAAKRLQSNDYEYGKVHYRLKPVN
jgi:hypothetical protein